MKILIANLVIISDTDVISLSALPPNLLPPEAAVTHSFQSDASEHADEITDFNLKDATTRMETQLINAALKKYKTTTAAAEAMGIDISTLSKKRKKYGI